MYRGSLVARIVQLDYFANRLKMRGAMQYQIKENSYQ